VNVAVGFEDSAIECGEANCDADFVVLGIARPWEPEEVATADESLTPRRAYLFVGKGPRAEKMLLAARGNFPKPNFHASRNFDDTAIVILWSQNDHEGFIPG
jgi:hypothetical protein